MSSQLVFDNPRNRALLDNYHNALLHNPRWEPQGNMRHGRGRDTYTIDGEAYYKNTSYGIPNYLHTNERPLPFKIAGKLVSDILDLVVLKGVKYAVVGAAIAGTGVIQPELIPVSVLLATDLAPEISKKLRSLIKEKTGYGRLGVMDDDEDEANKPEINEIKKVKNKKRTVTKMTATKKKVKKVKAEKKVKVEKPVKAEKKVKVEKPVKNATRSEAMKAFNDEVRSYVIAHNISWAEAIQKLKADRTKDARIACIDKCNKIVAPPRKRQPKKKGGCCGNDLY